MSPEQGQGNLLLEAIRTARQREQELTDQYRNRRKRWAAFFQGVADSPLFDGIRPPPSSPQPQSQNPQP